MNSLTKLHLCRLLFIQYKNTWLVGIRLCRLRITEQYGRNFVVKCEGDNLVSNQDSHRVDAELTFYIYRFSILIFRGVLRATLITLCFVLADDLHINILTLVAGHGAIASLLPLISYWIKTRTAL